MYSTSFVWLGAVLPEKYSELGSTVLWLVKYNKDPSTAEPQVQPGQYDSAPVLFDRVLYYMKSTARPGLWVLPSRCTRNFAAAVPCTTGRENMAWHIDTNVAPFHESPQGSWSNTSIMQYLSEVKSDV